MPAPATTVRDLVVGALVDCGAFGRGMPPPADAINRGLQRLNWMLSQWNRKRWLCYRIRDLTAAAAGVETYDVGPGATFDSIGPRPAKIYYAFMRQIGGSITTPVDYPLMLIDSHEDYSRIRLKMLKSWPYAAFYDPTLPNGLVYFWPLPSAPYELHIGISELLLRYASLNDLVLLPEEYEAAIYYNLQVILGANYRIAQNPVVIGLAKDSLNVLRDANNAVSTLVMPLALSRRGRYNIYSDNN